MRRRTETASRTIRVVCPRVQMESDALWLAQGGPAGARIYRFPAPSATFGRLFPEEKARELARKEKVPPGRMARRPTGGGFALHENDICFSLLLPARGRALRPLEIYRKIHLFIAWNLGREVKLVETAPARGGAVCFQEPTRFDLLFQGRKILGGALARGRGVWLYQGALKI